MLPHARVLVADDDADLLHTVASALERYGVEVVLARSGAELIQKMADEGPFALVVTDVSMPWMSGLDVIHSARHAGLGTPVIVMTALRDERVAERVRALGRGALLLTKPFRLADLMSAVAHFLGERGL